MKRKGLRHGYTTGACAAAAAKGAALMLRDRLHVEEVEIMLPSGEVAVFRLHGQELGENLASCFVIKDAGDDPDVTNGAEIHATVVLELFPPSPQPSPTRGEGAMRESPPPATRGDELSNIPPPLVGGGEGEGCRIVIEGGVGIGRVTKPGLAVPVGEWAINPVPRKMISEALNDVFASDCPLSIVRCPLVLISIPNGEELAKKTLNARLGIIGGLSILGTTGIVKPISAQAWTDTIEAAIDVSLACGCSTLVLSTGRTSEQAAQRSFDYPEEAYLMMGDHVGFALQTCARKGVKSLVIAGQFAKLLKIACEHEQTHVSSSRLDLRTLADWLKTSPHVSHLTSFVLQAGTAREILEASGKDPELISLVCVRAAVFAGRLAPGLSVKVLLAGYGGEVLYYGPNSR